MTFSRRSKMIILLVALVSLTTGVLATNYVEKRIQSTGYVFTLNLGIGIYSDPECTNILSLLNWGTLTAGESASNTIYIKNTGNTPLQINIATANWTPTDGSTHITLTSNVNDFILNPGSAQTAILTLTVSSSIQGDIDFGFDIVVGGNQ